MTAMVSARQKQILELLLEKKTGCSIDEIANALNISRNAVQQHLSSLERDDFIQVGALDKTAGRPVRRFILTETGINYFPKQYAWFTELLVTDLKKEIGSQALQKLLHNLGKSLAEDLSSQFAGKSPHERPESLVQAMDDLGYQAKLIENKANKELYIQACNCVYHDIAQKHQEVCAFDIALIESLLEKEIELVECMAEGGHLCKFKILNQL